MLSASQPSLEFLLCSERTSQGEGRRVLLPSISWEQDQSLDLQKSCLTDHSAHPTGLHHPALPFLTRVMGIPLKDLVPSLNTSFVLPMFLVML